MILNYLSTDVFVKNSAWAVSKQKLTENSLSFSLAIRYSWHRDNEIRLTFILNPCAQCPTSYILFLFQSWHAHMSPYPRD